MNEAINKFFFSKTPGVLASVLILVCTFIFLTGFFPRRDLGAGVGFIIVILIAVFPAGLGLLISLAVHPERRILNKIIGFFQSMVGMVLVMSMLYQLNTAMHEYNSALIYWFYNFALIGGGFTFIISGAYLMFQSPWEDWMDWVD